jgi:hypothetical protein
MAATILDIADAVVAALNGATLSQTFVAERFYVPVKDLQRDLGSLKVLVVPKSLALVPVSRNSDDHTYLIDIAIQKRISKDALTNIQKKAECDPLVRLMEEIVDLFRGKALAGQAGVSCMKAENPWVFDPGSLDEEGTFLSLATLHFAKVRDRS